MLNALGFVAVILATASIAWSGPVVTPSGVRYEIHSRGTGTELRAGQVVIAHYVGTLADGTVFDSSRGREQPLAFTLSRPAVEP